MSGQGPEIFQCVKCRKKFIYDDLGQINDDCYCFNCFKKFLESINPEIRYDFIAGDNWTESQKEQLLRIAESYEDNYRPDIKGID